jgi:holo-[acyl-carrier protein] synthase
MEIGIDIIETKRIDKLLKNKRALLKVFSEVELKAVDYSYLRLAARWAAKEAYFKAIKKKIDWLRVVIKNDKNGAPFFEIDGKIQKKAKLSLSHEKNYAVAVVIIA